MSTDKKFLKKLTSFNVTLDNFEKLEKIGFKYKLTKTEILNYLITNLEEKDIKKIQNVKEKGKNEKNTNL